MCEKLLECVLRVAPARRTMVLGAAHDAVALRPLSGFWAGRLCVVPPTLAGVGLGVARKARLARSPCGAGLGTALVARCPLAIVC